MALRPQPFIALGICLQPVETCVMSTVHFDNEPPLRAKEIDNIGPERRLPPESQTIKLAVANDLPQLEFGRGSSASASRVQDACLPM